MLTVSGIAGCDFGKVPVVVSLHLEVEHFTLRVAGLWDQELVQETLLKTSQNL